MKIIHKYNKTKDMDKKKYREIIEKILEDENYDMYECADGEPNMAL